MATPAATLITRVRTYLRDWPTTDVLTAAITTTNATTFTVTDATIYSPGWIVQIDQEALQVVSGVSTTVTVRRGARGTTPATHANSATILTRPAFLDTEILDSLNAGIDGCYPYVYKEILDSSLTVAADTYEYTVPNLPTTTVPIPRLWKVETKVPGDAAYRKRADWTIAKGATPKLKFRDIPYPGSVVRLTGYGPFSHLLVSDSTDAQWPMTADPLLVKFAASELLASGEAGRVRQDTGARDDREAAVRPGSSSAAGRDAFQRFKDALLNGAHCPPMQPHLVVTY